MTTNAPTATDHLNVLRKSLEQSTPWTSGVLDVREDDLSLFYKSGEDLGFLNFASATDEHLEKLAAACQPASFGLGKEDVLDENYRKAGKLDCANFASSLDIASLQIIDAIRPDLLDGRDDGDDKMIRPELYKLNVYGPGSFFKSHKDTPRGDNMIGSLVIVLPTKHDGGELSLSHGKESSTFDSASDLADKKTSIAYVAFFSDVLHAVEKVTSGYRVTLTYNLFLVDRPSSRLVPTRQPSAAEAACEAALRALVADPTFLPAGGILGFGLTHQYPIPRDPEDPRTLKHVLTILKGADARMHSAASRAGLETSLKLVYEIDDEDDDYDSMCQVALSKVIDTENMFDDDRQTEEAILRAGKALRYASRREIGKVKRDRSVRSDDSDTASDSDSDDSGEDGPGEPGVKARPGRAGKTRARTAIHWVTELTEMNRARSGYVAMGNEPELCHHYGDAALFVRFPAASKRQAQ